MARRGNGEGSIYQSQNGRWRGYVDLGYVDGKRRRKYVTGRTRKGVAAQLRVAVDARDAGTLQIGQKQITFGEWLTFYVDTIAAAKVRPSTLAGYRGYINRRIMPGLGHHRLDKLQPEHLEAFYRASQDDGMAAASVLQMHHIISRSLKIAHRRAGSPATSQPWSTRPPSSETRSNRSVPPRRAPCSRTRESNGTPRGGQSP